jgi:elongation factor 1-gamma
MWLSTAFIEFAPVTNFLMNQVYGKQGYNAGMAQKAQGDLRQLLTMINEHLKLRTVLVGVKLSVADFALAAQLEKYFQFFMDEKLRNSFVHVSRWMLFVAGQEEWRRAFGKLRLCEKAWSFDNYKKDEKKDEKKAEKKVEKKVEKKEEKKAEKKPEPKPAANPLEKQKNPLDMLPPTNLNFFDFKTMIVNAKNKKEAIDWLFENFDHEGCFL